MAIWQDWAAIRDCVLTLSGSGADSHGKFAQASVYEIKPASYAGLRRGAAIAQMSQYVQALKAACVNAVDGNCSHFGTANTLPIAVPKCGLLTWRCYHGLIFYRYVTPLPAPVLAPVAPGPVWVPVAPNPGWVPSVPVQPFEMLPLQGALTASGGGKFPSEEALIGTDPPWSPPQIPLPSRGQVAAGAAGVSVGVILYWTISELSRLFPPRNLVPIL